MLIHLRVGMKSPKKTFNFDVVFTRRVDGLWTASVADLPGVKASARTRKDAQAAVETLALKVLVDRMAQGKK
jgi:predicted RNase H-like HicB family nuclease